MVFLKTTLSKPVLCGMLKKLLRISSILCDKVTTQVNSSSLACAVKFNAPINDEMFTNSFASFPSLTTIIVVGWVPVKEKKLQKMCVCFFLNAYTLEAAVDISRFGNKVGYTHHITGSTLLTANCVLINSAYRKILIYLLRQYKRINN